MLLDSKQLRILNGLNKRDTDKILYLSYFYF